MQRRAFLRFLGIAPVAGVASVASGPLYAGGYVKGDRGLIGEKPSEQVVTLKIDAEEAQAWAREVERSIRRSIDMREMRRVRKE